MNMSTKTQVVYIVGVMSSCALLAYAPASLRTEHGVLDRWEFGPTREESVKVDTPFCVSYFRKDMHSLWYRRV